MKEIKLSQGYFTQVDDEDYEWLMQHKWCLSETYARTSINGRLKYMHRLILNAQDGQMVDHIDRVPLNNQKSNLRFCTRTQNNRNIKGWSRSYSRFVGVSFIKSRNKWESKIYCNGKSKFLGYFDEEETAARAYDSAAKILHREFASLNFPDEI